MPETEKPDWQVQQWLDLEVHVRIRHAYDVIIEYEVRTLVVENEGWAFETCEEGSGGITHTHDCEKAIKLIYGDIKWDGCGHHYFGESGYIHSCGGEFQMVRMGEIYKRLYAWVRQLHPEWML